MATRLNLNDKISRTGAFVERTKKCSNDIVFGSAHYVVAFSISTKQLKRPLCFLPATFSFCFCVEQVQRLGPRGCDGALPGFSGCGERASRKSDAGQSDSGHGKRRQHMLY